MRPLPGADPFAGLQAQMVPIQRPPTPEELEQVKRVERMQVRTQAGNWAATVLAGSTSTPAEFVELAAAMEAFIWGSDGAGAGPSRI